MKFNIIPAVITIGNTFKIWQDYVKYDLHKFSFSNIVTILWLSLSDTVEQNKNRTMRTWAQAKLTSVSPKHNLTKEKIAST